MTSEVNLSRSFARACVAVMKSAPAGNPQGGFLSAISMADENGDRQLAAVLRSVVEPMTLTDVEALVGQRAVADFTGAVRAASILGNLRQARNAGFEVPVAANSAIPVSFWIGEGQPLPLARLSLSATTLPPRTVATMCAFTAETLRLTDAARIVEGELVAGCANALDEAFIDPNNSGITDVKPASITYGVTPLASSGNPLTDLKALIADFAGDLSTAYLVTDPITATELALFTDSGGAVIFADAGPRGGSVVTLPLLASTSSPRDSTGGILALVDASAVIYGLDEIRIDTSKQTDLAMSDAPNAPSTVVSMFQTNSSAIRVLQRTNWALVRAGVSYISGASY